MSELDMFISQYWPLTSILITIGGVAFGVFSWIWNKGKKEGKDESCIERIESTVLKLQKDFSEEVKSTNECHQLIHNRINETKKDVSDIKSGVAKLDGKFDILQEILKKKLS